MKIKITFTEIAGEPSAVIEIPKTCSSIEFANKRQENSGKEGWDAVTEFEKGIAECLADGITVDIVSY